MNVDFTELFNANTPSNGVSYDLPGGASVFLIAPADKPKVKGLHVALFIPPGSHVKLESLRAEVLGPDARIACNIVDESVNGLDPTALSDFLTSGMIENSGRKTLQVGISLFVGVELPRRFILRLPLLSVGGLQQKPDFFYAFSDVRGGYMLMTND